MKEYIKPKMIIQEFHASEYIAACDTMYAYTMVTGLGTWTLVSYSDVPIFDSYSQDTDGFVMRYGGVETFVPHKGNYLLLNGQPSDVTSLKLTSDLSDPAPIQVNHS